MAATTIAGLSPDELLALRALDRDAVSARFGGARTTPGVRYERADAVDRLDPQDLGAHFFFRGEDLVVVYVPRRSLEGMDPNALRAELGSPAAALRSRAGAESSLLVWPERGIAFSTDGSRMDILEIFPPTTLEGYKDAIYQDPGEFIR